MAKKAKNTANKGQSKIDWKKEAEKQVYFSNLMDKLDLFLEEFPKLFEEAIKDEVKENGVPVAKEAHCYFEDSARGKAFARILESSLEATDLVSDIGLGNLPYYQELKEESELLDEKVWKLESDIEDNEEEIVRLEDENKDLQSRIDLLERILEKHGLTDEL